MEILGEFPAQFVCSLYYLFRFHLSIPRDRHVGAAKPMREGCI
jgi:hypothetical protein